VSENRGEVAGLGGRRATDAPQAQLATMTLAILLVAGDKSYGSQKCFSQQLIALADRRFSALLKRLNVATKKGK